MSVLHVPIREYLADEGQIGDFEGDLTSKTHLSFDFVDEGSTWLNNNFYDS